MTLPASAPTPGDPVRSGESPLLKLALEMGPLLVFFLANNRPELFRPLLRPLLSAALVDGPQGGIFVATAAFMAAMALSLVLTKALLGKLPVMPLVSGAMVLVFGGLTLWLADEQFIKLKPTIANALFGVALLGGLLFGRSLLALVFDSVFRLTSEGWRRLTFRWGVFFFVLAALNELTWRLFPTDVWVAFKVWGIVPLTMAFSLAQLPLLQRHALTDDAPQPAAPAAAHPLQNDERAQG